MGITMTIEIYDEEDANNVIAALKAINAILIEYEETYEKGSFEYDL